MECARGQAVVFASSDIYRIGARPANEPLRRTDLVRAVEARNFQDAVGRIRRGISDADLDIFQPSAQYLAKQIPAMRVDWTGGKAGRNHWRFPDVDTQSQPAVR